MIISKMRHLTWVALFFFPTALLSETAPSAATISLQNVANALSAAGLPVSATQIEFLSAVPTRHLNPILEVTTISRTSVEDALIKLRCRPGPDCIPFYVLARGVSTEAWKNPAPSGRPAPPVVTARYRRPIVHGGDHASLVLDGTRFRITLPVMILENGARGQTIRVTSLDRKRTYRAEAIEPHLVRGSL